MVAQLDRQLARAAPGRVVPRLLSYALFEGRPATTRGRWFNPVVHANLALGARLPLRRPVTAPIFLTGIGRSGTTLLGTLFGAHPDVGFLNEPKAMWSRIVPDEDLIGSYRTEPARLRIGSEDATARRREAAHALYGWYAYATRSARVVDKYPELVYRPELVRALFPDSHLVVITRQPWDVISSIDTWGAGHATDDADWWGIDDRKWQVLWEQGLLVDETLRALTDVLTRDRASSAERAAVEWLLGTAEGIDLVARGLPRVHQVRYEDLMARPADTFGRLLERCELSLPAPLLDLAAERIGRRNPPSAPRADLPPPLVDQIERVAAAAGYG